MGDKALLELRSRHLRRLGQFQRYRVYERPIWLCSSGPHFNGTPPLESGAPTLPWSYRDNWQGRCRELSVLILLPSSGLGRRFL